VNMRGEYREIARPDRLVLTWRRDSDAQETIITVVFRADGGGTVLSLRQDGFGDAGMCARHEQGWGGDGGSFEKLAALLAQEAGLRGIELIGAPQSSFVRTVRIACEEKDARDQLSVQLPRALPGGC